MHHQLFMTTELPDYNFEKIIQKAATYCTYQERCEIEVREKLQEWKVGDIDADLIIEKLTSDNFINDERYAIAFAGGKFRMKQWGKFKIKLMLQQKNISSQSIAKALNQIDKSDYQNTLKKLLKEAEKKITEKNPLRRNHLISQQLIAKGFEPDMVWNYLGGERLDDFSDL